MSNYTFTPDDQMQPVYCRDCHAHIPRAETMQHGGRCEECAAARIAAQHAAAQEAAFQAQQAAFHAQQAAMFHAQQRAAQSAPPPVYTQPTTIITPVYIQQPAPRRKGLNCCFALGCLLPFLLTIGGCALLTIFGSSGDTKPVATPPAQTVAAPASTYVPDTSGKPDAASSAADKLVSDPNYHPAELVPPPAPVFQNDENGEAPDEPGNPYENAPGYAGPVYSGPIYSGGKTTYVHDYTRRNRNGTTSHVRGHYRR